MQETGILRLKFMNTDYADILIHLEDERFQTPDGTVGEVGSFEADKRFW